jgi:2-methylcitrate dehydratase PrpD
VIGSSLRTAAAEAAFVNGVRGHGLIREDMHLESGSHIGVVVLPTALALAEREDQSGAAFAGAVVAGYEIMARLGRALLTERFATHFRPTGTFGPVAAAAASAPLLDLTHEQATAAIGFAGNFGCGLNEWSRAGGTEIYFHAGVAARNGILAAELAQLGGEASASIIEGRSGMLAAYGAGLGRAPLVTDELGARFEILSVFHKPAPACNYVQTPAQAALRLVAESPIDPGEVTALRIASFPAAMAYPGCDHTGPFETLQQAKMSIQFTVASVLARGGISEANYRQLEDPNTLRLAALAELASDPAFSAAYPRRQGAEVTVALKDGSRLRARLDDLASLDDDAVRARFRTEVGTGLSPDRAARIEEAVAGLRDLASIRSLTRLVGAGEMEIYP